MILTKQLIQLRFEMILVIAKTKINDGYTKMLREKPFLNKHGNLWLMNVIVLGSRIDQFQPSHFQFLTPKLRFKTRLEVERKQ